MTAPANDVAVDRFDDDGGRIRSERDGNHPFGRLVWAPAVPGRRLDGAWWPRTRDATAELAALVPLASEHLGGSVRRVSINIDAWGADRPRRLRTGDGLVRLGWFHTLDPATVTLRSGSGRVTLVVIPPGLDPATAQRLLRRLSTSAEWPDTAASALSGAWRDDGTEGAT